MNAWVCLLACCLVSPALAADLEHGKKAFAACAACHETEPERVGPPLAGIVGRKAGSLPGFAYSNPMKRAGFVWDTAHLVDFVQDPQSVVSGTRMAFSGLDDPRDAADLVAYLAQLRAAP
nr:c-type cytochrome [uncultured Rhodopila sp.]